MSYLKKLQSLLETSTPSNEEITEFLIACLTELYTDKCFINNEQKTDFEDRLLEIILENNLLNNQYLTSLKNAYEELHKALNIVQIYSFTDSLTKLNNRRYLWDRIVGFIEKAVIEEISISCLMIDFDDFKKINDTYGHLVGDKVLFKSCQTIKTLFSEEDMVIRFGGEEILVLLYNQNLEKALKKAEETRKAVEDLLMFSDTGDCIRITVSIGIYSPKTLDHYKPHMFDKIIMEADKAMYHAKKIGKNNVVATED